MRWQTNGARLRFYSTEGMNMAIISMWQEGVCSVRVDTQSIRVDVVDVGRIHYIRLSNEEAAKLRDDLSRAITEAATAAAKAVEGEAA